MRACALALGCLLIASSARASIWEATFGGALDKADSGGAFWGLSARVRYISEEEGGWLVQSNFGAISILAYDAVVGYIYRTKGSVFFEIGGGVAYSPIFSARQYVVVGAGVHLDGKWHFVLPIDYRGSQITYYPYIGMKF